jgi:hypothetical protein
MGKVAKKGQGNERREKRTKNEIRWKNFSTYNTSKNHTDARQLADEGFDTPTNRAGVRRLPGAGPSIGR